MAEQCALFWPATDVELLVELAMLLENGGKLIVRLSDRYGLVVDSGGVHF